MKRWCTPLALLSQLLATPAQAEQYWTTTRIVQIGAVAQDLDYPHYSDVIYIGVEDREWLPETCRQMPGLLARADDTALLLMAKAAFEHGRPVVVKADDQGKIGEYCRFFQITDTAP
jgi:hypothetical protein